MNLALLAAAWLAGLLLGFRADVDARPTLLLAFAALSLALMLRVARRPAWPAILAALLLLGLWRVEVIGEPVPLVTQWSQSVALKGRVQGDPEATGQSIRFTLAVESVGQSGNWQPAEGKVLARARPPGALVTLRDSPYFRYGDTLEMVGVLERPEPFDGFDYPSYLSNQGITGIFWARQVYLVGQGDGGHWRAWIFGARRTLARSIASTLPSPQSSLAHALLLGLRGGLPPEVVEDFRAAGAAHLLAISGLHVGTLLVLSVVAAAGLLGRQRQLYLLAPLIAIWLYALISGLPPSVARAAIMGSALLAGLGLGRPRSVLPVLALAAILMSAHSPQVVRQVSFQLSFAAMAGIVLVLPYQSGISSAISARVETGGEWWRPWLSSGLTWAATGLMVSAAATLATWPLVAQSFQRIPALGLLTTMLALPALPLILLSGAVTALLGLLHPVAGQILGWFAWGPLSYLLALVSLVPGKTVSGAWVGAPLVWGWYLALAGLLLLPGRLAGLGWLARWRPALAGPVGSGGLVAVRPTKAALFSLGAALIMAGVGTYLWLQVISGADGELHVYFFDVGQGDSALIVTPGGRQMLVDGGPGIESAARALSRAMPPGDWSLDLVALTHLDSDHGQGLLEALERYRVGSALVGWEDPRSPLYPQWRDALQSRQLQVIRASAGYRVELDKGVTLEVLHPRPDPAAGALADSNNSGLVMRLVYGQVSFLLAADIEAEAERQLLWSGADLKSDVLKVAHHGSRTSTTEAFLERVSPTTVVISAGADNRFGHPHPEVVARLAGAVGLREIYETAHHGDIEFITDGTDLRVQTER